MYGKEIDSEKKHGQQAPGSGKAIYSIYQVKRVYNNNNRKI